MAYGLLRERPLGAQVRDRRVVLLLGRLRGIRRFGLASSYRPGYAWRWVSDLDDWEAREISWVSPLHRMVKSGAISSDQLAGVLFEAPRKILEVVARKAFWRFGHTRLKVLASHIGASAGTSVFETLVNLYRAVMGDIGDEELSAILEHRIALDQMTAACGPRRHPLPDPIGMPTHELGPLDPPAAISRCTDQGVPMLPCDPDVPH